MNRSFTIVACVMVEFALVDLARAAQTVDLGGARVGFWTPKEPPRAHYKIEAAIHPAEQGTLQGRGRETIRRHDQYKIRINRAWIEKRLEEPFRRE